MTEINTCTTTIQGLINRIVKLNKDGVDTDERQDWLRGYIDQWMMV